MGKRGPKPKSAILESLQGFPGRRKKATNAKLAAVDNAQETHIDSRNVPANSPPNSTQNTESVGARELPAYLKSKREREIWLAITTCPVRSMWFKTADMPLIARHVSKLARLEAMMRRRIPVTYETRTGAGERIIRANPEYRALIALDREVRAEEQLLAGNPVARLTLETKTGEVRDPVPPVPAPGLNAGGRIGESAAEGAAARDHRTGALPSPLGILKTNTVPPSTAH